MKVNPLRLRFHFDGAGETAQTVPVILLQRGRRSGPYNAGRATTERTRYCVAPWRTIDSNGKSLRSGRNAWRPGFALIELLVPTAVVAILAALLLPA